MLSILIIAGLGGAETPRWEPVPLVTRESRTAGRFGGEGGQWPRAIAYAPSEPSFMMFGTDVGGLYRSRDGGRRWEPCNVGYSPRGTADFAIDPHNPQRVLSVGANTTDGNHHGLWLSTDGAASWRHVLPANISSNDDMREQLAFDPTTFDKSSGRTRVVYWSRIAEDRAHWGKPTIHPALYKSNDGGETWTEIPGSVPYGGSFLENHPRQGVLYAGNKVGFHRSEDGGLTFTRTLEGEVTGLDTSPAAPESVWLSKPDGVWRSDDAGKTWRKLPSEAMANGQDRLRHVTVSPADPDRLVVWRDQVPNQWDWPRFVSHDGGRTWARSTKDASGAFLPDNTRQGLFAWHPRDPRIVWSLGGDWPTRSDDGGKTYRWAGDGYNAVLVGGRWNFNRQYPNLIFFGSQDYNGAVTVDAGRTWTYLNPAGNGWGGYCYGGYAISKDVLVVGNAGGWGEPRFLRISRDGGRTWEDTKISLSGLDASYGDPRDPRVAFAFDHRTADGGLTWKKMEGCEGVLTHSEGPRKELYGVKGNSVVSSRDKGVTWQTVAVTPVPAADLAYDPPRNRLYSVFGERAWVLVAGKWSPLPVPPDQFGNHRARTIAVDPTSSSVVYIGSAGNIYSSHVAVLRSSDAGRTWVNLTRQKPLAEGTRDGGREAICIRVHPKTHEAYISTSCYGIWKIGPP